MTTRAGATKPFEGKVVLVTGATSGIGEAAVVAFRAAGASVFGTARTTDTLGAARARHLDVKWLKADVSRAGEVKAAVEAMVREAGRLDVLVNNAAVFRFASLEESTEELVRSHFEINVYGASFAAQAALPALKASRGAIINVSSAAGHKPSPGGSHYAASKAAVESLTRSWALELAPAGVRVNAVAPGPTDTPGFDKMGLPPEGVAAAKSAFLSQVPLGRMAAPEEIARWLVALADPGAAWVTGALLAVDGGMSLT